MPVVEQLPHEPYLDGAPESAFRWRLGLRPLDVDDPVHGWFDDGPDAAGWIAEKPFLLTAHRETVFVVRDDILPEAREVARAISDHRSRHGQPSRLAPGLHPLEAAARLVAEDLVLMVERPEGLVVGGGCVCFPNRWDLRSKVGRSLTEVHEPVPSLNEQLGVPVDRFLDRLTPERPYWRLGWGIIDVPQGYTPVDGTGPARPSDPDPVDLFVRVERETLRRFPRTGCVLFTIRTYVAALPDVASSPAARRRLASGVETMTDAVREYKDLTDLAERVVDFLRKGEEPGIEVDRL